MQQAITRGSKAGWSALAVVALVLGGCSGRDTDGAEQLAAAQDAARRAEAAADRAEKAARSQSASAPAPMVEEPAEADDEDTGPDLSANQDSGSADAPAG